MQAMVIEAFGGPEKLHLIDMQKPAPNADEVLIRAVYAGVNPVDWKIREGYLQSRLPHEFPIILGWDVAGTVEAVGKNVRDLKIGDEVFAYVRKPLVKWGTYAEYVVSTAKNVAKKPKNISFAEAAALPLVSLTAWQSIFDSAHLKKGETLFIQGGSGAVGSMAIQFAKYAGASVLATASTKKYEYVRKLGTDLAIDYKGNIVDQVKAAKKDGVDVVFDCVGGESFKKCLPCLKKGGRIISLIEHLEPAEAEKLGITANYVFVEPNGDQLLQIAQLIEENKIAPLPIEEMMLQDAGLAQEKVRSGAVMGKIVLKI